MKKAEPSRYAAALQYLQQMRDRAADFGGGVVDTLADRARDVGGLALEAFTSDPNIGRMTTAEFSQAADRPTPRLDQAAQDLGTIGKAIVTQPVQTGKALVQGEVERAQQAMTSPRAAGEYAGSMVDPMRIAAALRKTAPIAELDVYHGTPHRFPETEANPLGEFDASKIGTGEGAQAYGHGIYLAESPDVAKGYQKQLAQIKPEMTVEFGLPITGKSKKFAETALQNSSGDADSAIKNLRENLQFYSSVEAKNAATEAINALKTAKITWGKDYPIGHFYKADLPDEMIDRMLDWDKPLSEQSEAVRRVLMPMVMAKMKERGTPPYALEYSANRALGGDIVKNLFVGTGLASKDVSRMLKEAGIPGVRYLDAGSRGGSGTGTRNFVVFPGEEKKVKIFKRD
jgi:hypothetical protein